MKSLKETLSGIVLLVYGHAILTAMMFVWTMFYAIVWNKAPWIHILVACIAGLLFYGTIGFVIGRLDRKRTTIRNAARIFWGVLAIGFFAVLLLQERNVVDWRGTFNVIVYPIALFFKNAPSDRLIQTAFAIVLYLSYRGVLTGFSFQRRLMRARGGKR